MTNKLLVISGGSDSNSGEAGFPLASMQYAAELLPLIPGKDTIILQSTADNPLRGGFVPPANSTCGGESSAAKANLVGSIDVSPGTTIPNLYRNGEIDAWLTAASLYNISQSVGDPIEKSTDSYIGKYSINATRIGTSIWLYQNVYLPAATSVTFSYYHKEAAAGAWRFSIKEATGANYLQLAGNWAVGAYTFVPGDNSALWHQYSLTFTTNNAGLYQINLAQWHNGTLYLDNIRLDYDGITLYDWENVPAKNYKLLNVLFPLEPKLLAKCTAAEWLVSGVDALSVLDQAASLVALDTSPGEWFYDSAADQIYYCPEVGEIVTDLHFELSQPCIYGTAHTQSSGILYLNNSDVTIQNLDLRFGNNTAIITGAAKTGLVINDLVGVHAYGNIFRVLGASAATFTRCHGQYGDDIFSVETAGSILIAYQCLAEYAADDGFQSVTNSKMYCYYCISSFNGLELAADNTGFSAEGGDTMELYNCLAYGNYGKGIDRGNLVTVVIKNCIAYGTVLGADASVPVVHNPFTHTNNIFGTKAADWVLDPTETLADPLFVSAPTDLRLDEASPAINFGIDVGLLVDYSGHPVPQCGGYDAGAYEHVYDITSLTVTEIEAFGLVIRDDLP